MAPMSDTQPHDILSDTQPRTNPKRGRWVFVISALVILAGLALGGLAGYASGIAQRVNFEQTSVGKTLDEQFNLAQKDFAEGRYEVANQRLNYINGKNPNYPGLVDMMSKVMLQMLVTPSITPTPIPSITPTPDLRSQDAIFAQAQEQMKNKDWTNAMASLDALRKAGPTYKTVQVDGMYYAALRSRGMDQIMGNGAYAQTTNLEGGIYDLTLAERFAPLDGLADGMRNFARVYLIGASFWGLDWAQAADYFGQVYAYAPNLRDSSNFTAAARYREALLRLGDQQASAAKLKDRCVAITTWNQADQIGALDGDYPYKYNQLFTVCFPPTQTPPPTVEAVPTEEPSPTTGP